MYRSNRRHIKVKNNDIEAIRQVNTILVLNTLRRTNRLLSRPDMAQILGLSKVTVANIIRILNEQGYAVEAGVGSPDSRGGRKPVLVALDCDSKRALGAKVGHDSIDLLISDLKGRTLKRLTSPLRPNENLSALLTAMSRDILAATGTGPEVVVGLVAAVPGSYSAIDCRSGLEAVPADLQALEKRLAEELRLPVKLVSFTRARAFAECWYNQDYGNPQPFFYLNLSHNLDGAAVRRNTPEDTPRELGACYMAPRPYEAPNENPVTLNQALGRDFFDQKSRKVFGRTLDGGDLTSLAGSGNAQAREIFSEYGYNLGCAISLIINMVCINNIVLGGSYARAWPYFQESMHESLDLHISEKIRGRTEVRPLKAGLESGLSGALALALDNWVYQTRVLYNSRQV